MATQDVENTNRSTKGTDLQLVNKRRSVPRGRERMPLIIQRQTRTTQHWSIHPQRVQEKESQKATFGVDWLQKSVWYGYAKMVNKQPRNLQDIRLCYKLYWKNYENLESWNTSGRGKLSWSKDPKRYIIGRCTSICNRDDSNHPQTQENAQADPNFINHRKRLIT